MATCHAVMLVFFVFCFLLQYWHNAVDNCHDYDILWINNGTEYLSLSCWMNPKWLWKHFSLTFIFNRKRVIHILERTTRTTLTLVTVSKLCHWQDSPDAWTILSAVLYFLYLCIAFFRTDFKRVLAWHFLAFFRTDFKRLLACPFLKLS